MVSRAGGRLPESCAANRTTDEGRSVSPRLIELKRIKLAPIELVEAVTDVLKQQPQLLLVIFADHSPGSPAPGFLAIDIPDTCAVRHARNPPPRAD
jgi:hypothetical protein